GIGGEYTWTPTPSLVGSRDCRSTLKRHGARAADAGRLTAGEGARRQSDDQKNSKCNEAAPRDSRDRISRRSDFLDEHEPGEQRDPEEVHHADGEQDAHQRPAASKTVAAVTCAHLKRTEISLAPVRHEESQRALTMRQAGTLQR